MERLKHIIKIGLACGLALLTALSADAQYDCKEYEKFNCAPSADKRLKRNGQSRSAMVQIGDVTEMNIIIYKGQDYRISLCADQGILGNVSFRLVEIRRELIQEAIVRKDSAHEASETLTDTRERGGRFETVRNIVYDNTTDDMSQSIEFSATATKRIVLEIIAPGSQHPKRLKNPDAPDIGCLGVLVEHMTTPSLGF